MNAKDKKAKKNGLSPNIFKNSLKKTTLLVTLFFCFLSYAQAQRNYAQELVNLLHQERYFEAKDFKKQHAEQLPQNDKALDLVYNIHMSLAFNKPDSAIVYLEEFLGNPDYIPILGPMVAAYYPRLSGVYEDTQQYAKSISTAEKYIDYLERNPYSLAQGLIKSETKDAQTRITLLKDKLENEPLRRIVRDSDVQDIKLKDSEYIRFDAQYNGHEIETFFDTGVSHFFFIEEDLANDIGVKIRPNQDTVQMLNGRSVKAVEGIIDSIDLKGVKLYNIPVAVFKEKFLSNLPDDLDPMLKADIEKAFSKSRQIIMGLPTIKMIGKFEFDWKENILRLPTNQIADNENSDSNFLLLKNTPYLNLKINDCDFTGFFDTGNNQCLYLTLPYLRSNINNIKIDMENVEQSFNVTTFNGFHPNIKRFKVINPQVYFNDKNFNGNLDVYATETIWPNMNVLDGEVGVKFVKNIGSKCILDFNSMTLKSED